MAAVAGAAEETTPLSLYIDLEEGTRGDLEVVSRAAIAWSKTIREAAFLVEPFLEVRVELVSGTEGSINLNSIIHAVRGVISDPKKLKAIGLGIAAFFAMEAGSWVVGKGYDALWEWAYREIPEFVASLTQEERDEVEGVVTLIAQSKSAQDKAQSVYAELSRDNKVTGVGVSFRPGERPRDVVPREQFAARAGELREIEDVVTRRIVRDRVLLTLISPALSEEDYKWRFRLGEKTLWAHMDDPDLRARIMPGSNSAPRMLAGIQMDVDLETTQELRDGVWVIIDHHVVQVHGLREPPSQPNWLDSPTERSQPH